ncbi:MAG: signal peptidase I [Nanoarchaeota archaeon]
MEKNFFKKFLDFLREDSWSSMIVTLILAFLIIKFVLFPSLSFITGTKLPLVIVESCSMYHSTELKEIVQNSIYSEHNINFDDTKNWNFKNGINKGDIIFVVGPDNLKNGDVIIFSANTNHPIIHRIISINKTVTTKGDNNNGLLEAEKNIQKEQIIGRAVFRIPLIGWIKLVFYEPFRNPNERGLC